MILIAMTNVVKGADVSTRSITNFPIAGGSIPKLSFKTIIVLEVKMGFLTNDI